MEPNQNEELEIDLWAVISALRDKIFVILLAACTGAVLFYLGSALLITPTYDSTTKIYVLSKQDENNTTITYSDLQTSTQLTKDYMELVTTRPVLEEVISTLGLEEITYEDLEEQISVSTATDGRIISITVTDKNPLQAKEIADAVRNSVSAQILKVMDVEAVNVVEEANLPVWKSRPNNIKNAAIGGIIGLVLAVAIAVIGVVMDDRIKTTDDVERFLELSVLGTIPMEEGSTKKSMKKSKKAEKKSKKQGGHK